MPHVPVVSDIPRPKTLQVLPNPEPVTLQDVEWKVLTDKDALSPGEAFMSLTPKQYEILSQNMAELLRWVKEAAWRLHYYEENGRVDF